MCNRSRFASQELEPARSGKATRDQGSPDFFPGAGGDNPAGLPADGPTETILASGIDRLATGTAAAPGRNANRWRPPHLQRRNGLHRELGSGLRDLRGHLLGIAARSARNRRANEAVAAPIGARHGCVGLDAASLCSLCRKIGIPIHPNRHRGDDTDGRGSNQKASGIDRKERKELKREPPSTFRLRQETFPSRVNGNEAHQTEFFALRFLRSLRFIREIRDDTNRSGCIRVDPCYPRE